MVAWLAIRSNVALSFVGVILVTYASICGLGLSTAIGINFNAATTQIVPFLSLGLGIDDMFLLLHNYDEISHTMRKNEMGILLKETGMSVMVTSINNILAFCAGYVLPIPALRSFCSQTAVLLAFNLASLMFVFPAFNLRRRFVFWQTRSRLLWTKQSVDFTTLCGVAFGLYGMYTTTLGLELADVLPENTAPAAFMRCNEFFIVKANGKLQPYWMSMLRVWLESLQVAFEKDKASGLMDPVTGAPIRGKFVGRFSKFLRMKPAPESMIARRLICSYGHTYNCTGRVGLSPQSWSRRYNSTESSIYITDAWYNTQNMMYYVSQASFQPTPPSWQMGPHEGVVPPARPLLYSQIPFYQTNLTDTPVTVNMIEVMVIVVIVTIELGGFMGVFGIKMNPISAVTLISAVGIGVEFTAHVVLAFLTSLGSVDDRLESCLQHMFVPVFHGAISTLLGIVMLVFSEFDFVIKYFFVVMSTLVVLAVFNGLCLLPVLLTIIGPEPELIPTDGSCRLPAPPPLSEQYKKKAAMGVENGLRHRKGTDVEMSAKKSRNDKDDYELSKKL
ncbi:hypothetical protein OSTOST_02721 [Ostertagia ostertagi]